MFCCSPPPPLPLPLPPDARPSSPFGPLLPPIEAGRGLVVFFFTGVAGALGAVGVVFDWIAGADGGFFETFAADLADIAVRRRRPGCTAAASKPRCAYCRRRRRIGDRHGAALRRRGGHRHDRLGNDTGVLRRIRQRAQRNQSSNADASQCPSWDPRPVHRPLSIIFPCTCPVPTLISVCCRLSACEPVTLRVGVPPRVGILHGLQAPASDLLPNSNGTSPPCGRVDDPTHRYREPQVLDRPAFGDWGGDAWNPVCSRFGQRQACAWTPCRTTASCRRRSPTTTTPAVAKLAEDASGGGLRITVQDESGKSLTQDAKPGCGKIGEPRHRHATTKIATVDRLG